MTSLFGALIFTGMQATQPSLAEVAALVGNPARANMLTAVLDGRALTATELAYAAGKDCYEYRRELIARNTDFRYSDDWLLALDTAAKM